VSILDEHPALEMLQIAVPLWIIDMRSWTEEARIARARLAGQHIACHGDDLMYASKDGRSAEAFNQLAAGLAAAAYAPGGVVFAGMHFCANHAVCTGAAPESPKQARPAKKTRKVRNLALPAMPDEEP